VSLQGNSLDTDGESIDILILAAIFGIDKNESRVAKAYYYLDMVSSRQITSKPFTCAFVHS
jgi:hypothetical protein